MAWQDDIQPAAYTGPNGDRVEFEYEDVATSISKKTSAYNFPDADGTYIQDHGKTGRRFPMRCFFSGNIYNLAADAFEEILLQTGVGKLEHPMYGTHNVVPMGEITRSDALKTAGNQAIIEVTFWATIGVAYPASQVDPTGAVLSAVDAYNAAAAAELAAKLNTDTVSGLTAFKNNYQALLKNTQSALQSVAAVQDDINDEFNDIVDGINAGIDTLIRDPLTLAWKTTQMVQAPSRALVAIKARLDGYGNLAGDVFGSSDSVSPPASVGNFDDPNKFHTRNLYTGLYVTGSILASVNAGSTDTTGAKNAAVVDETATSDSGFTTRADALAAAEGILDQYAALTEWQDANYASVSGSGALPSTPANTDTGETTQALQQAVALGAGFLVEISFTLKQERVITLTKQRTIIDLAGEIYGEIDERLDQMIQSNNLSGDEIIELQPGRKIKYYV